MFVPRVVPNPHLAGIKARFGSLAVPPDALPPLRRVVLLCFTNRSGSNYLGSMLAGSRLLNLPLERLSADQVLRQADRDGLTRFADVIASIVGEAATEGNFALKVAPSHLEILSESGLLDHWRDRLHCIHLERLDRLGQAISWEIAHQTDQWTSLSAATAITPRYSHAGILAALESFADGNRHFALFFARNGLQPQHVLYEDFEAAPAAQIARLLAGMGLPPLRTRPELVRIRRRRGALNDAWRQQFLAQEAGR
jgi:LPS sulfotransferase NodH